ncbi:unnamed protein product [Zymoseptoria tritici ST99CH_3D1]|nr:unnamed protein product [Zymoseptoria tritici ST99CH_3D1]
MLPSPLGLLCLAVIAGAQDSSNSDSSSSSSVSSSRRSSSSNSRTNSDNQAPTFSFTNSFPLATGSVTSSVAITGGNLTYISATGQITRETSSSTQSSNGTISSNATATSNSQITRSSKSVDLVQITGGGASNATTTSRTSLTSSAPAPTNTVPCNGFPEFCNRQYSNITFVTAHNAAMVVPNNAASNQGYGIRTQLNDGIRMIQGQVHWSEQNQTLYNCHSSCDLLNAGPWENTLVTIREFLQDNPYEVVTMLIGNSDFQPVEKFVPAIQNAGLAPYLYEPQFVPQYRNQWPTIGQMILRNQRLVIFMDYDANQDSVPYILDEFTHMWETPFSPTDRDFPCTQQRPPDLNQTVAREQFMYLANHNLNQQIDLSAIGIDLGDDLLIPNTALLNVTNGEANQYGRLGAMSLNCTADWGRPPNFLLVDYYNIGSPDAGSVFDVAAQANGVVNTRPCCGTRQRSAATPALQSSSIALVAAVAFGVLISW